LDLEKVGMPVKLNSPILRRIATLCSIALLTISGASGQSSKEKEESRTKEMRQMWQNLVNRRPRTQVKISQPATPNEKPGTTAQRKPAKPQATEPQPGNDAPQPVYRIASSTIPAQGQELGITIWRLKPSQTADAKEVRQEVNLKRLEHKPNLQQGGTILLTAVRVDSDSQLREGDLIQISVEAPQDGFLYVIDREQYADENQVTYGAHYLIFPTARTNKGFNHVGPGVLINFPAMTDDPSYFELVRSRDQHVAEELTFVISPTPIKWRGEEEEDSKQIKLDEKQYQDFAKQMRAQTGRIEFTGGIGKAQTPAEAEAAKSSTSDGTKRLKHNSPPPQSIYRVAREPKESFFVIVLLRIGR
jgi:hypothetical protein